MKIAKISLLVFALLFAGAVFVNAESGSGSVTVVVSPAMSGTLTPATSSCDIQLNKDFCNIDFSWAVTNPVAPTSDVTQDGVGIVSSGPHTGANISFTIPYNTATFRLRNGTTELANSTVDSKCTTGTQWDVATSTCIAIVTPLPDLTAAAPTPTTASVGNPLQFSSFISNIGNAPTGTSFPYFFQVASAPDGTGQIRDLAPSSSIGPLAASGNFGASGTGISPWFTFSSAGIWSVRACADKTDSLGGGVINESDENNNCSSPWTNVTVSATAPSAPTNVVASAGACGTGTIWITWNASSGANSYDVLRSTTTGGPYTFIINVTGSPHADNSGLTSGTTYYYVVRANGPGGSSGNSTQTSAVAPASGCPLPDLTASAPSEDIAIVGTPATFISTISNDGNASTGVAFPNFFQISTSVSGSGNIIDLASSSMGILAAGASDTSSSSYTFEFTGTHSIRTCANKADSNNFGSVIESRFDNNCSLWVNVVVVAGGGYGDGGSFVNTCFIADTKVTLADDSVKNIQDIEIGDVLKGETSNNTVLAYHRPSATDGRIYGFNGGRLFVTEEHPFKTTEGWKSINPEKTKLENIGVSVTKLGIGDTLLTESGVITVRSIESKEIPHTTSLYNFVLSGDRTYYADGYLVHNKLACNINNAECPASIFCVDTTDSPEGGWPSTSDGFCGTTCSKPTPDRIQNCVDQQQQGITVPKFCSQSNYLRKCY